MLQVRPSLLPVALIAAALQACGFQPQPTVPAVDASPVLAPSTSPPPTAGPTRSPTDTAHQWAGPLSACTPPDLDAYVAVVSPLLDQVVIASQEATQLQALPTDRLTALVETTADIQDQLSAIQAPECLQDAHLAAVAGAALLRQALEGIVSGAYPGAEETLRASFEQTAQAGALIAMHYWEQTPIGTVSP